MCDSRAHFQAEVAAVGDVAAKTTGLDNVKVTSADGVRLRRGENGFELEYLLSVEDPDVKIWVPADNVAEDVKEDYEAQWWACCRAGDLEKVEYMLKGGGQALVAARDDDDRQGEAHFSIARSLTHSLTHSFEAFHSAQLDPRVSATRHVRRRDTHRDAHTAYGHIPVMRSTGSVLLASCFQAMEGRIRHSVVMACP